MCLCAVLWDHIFSSPLNTAILCLHSCYTLKFYIPLPLHHQGSTAAQGQVFTEPSRAVLQVKWGKKCLPCKQIMEREMEEEVGGGKSMREKEVVEQRKIGAGAWEGGFELCTWGYVEVCLFMYLSIYLIMQFINLTGIACVCLCVSSC